MTDRVAIFIVNYNMPEKADALYEYIEKHTIWPHDTYLIDNGSDLVDPARNTNIWVKPNKQTTAGWLAGLLEMARAEYFAYSFMITSADYPETGDPITPLVECLKQNPNAVGIHPALTLDSTTSWQHMITRGGDSPRRTWFIDNIASMYRADWFDSIGWFDPSLRYGWGIDLETCWQARKQGRGLYIHEGVKIRKITDVAYTMERMRMSADERRQRASDNMTFFLSQKYGDNWRWKMYEEFVNDEWR